MISHSQCPLCSSVPISFFMKCRDHFLTNESFSLFRCNSCKFIFTQDAPDETEAGSYYQSEKYLSHDGSATGLTGKIYFPVRRLMFGRKRRLITKLTGKTAGRLLDIGTGSGYFAGMMKNAGWNVTGIEPDIKASDHAAERFGFNVISPDQISGLPDSGFDCITLWHSLEHSHDLFMYPSEITRLLRPGGYCIIALPSAASLDAGYYKEFWAAWDVPRHLWHFTPDTFRLLAEKTGLDLLKTESLPFDVFYISLLSEKYRGANLPFLSGMMKGLRFYLAAFFRQKGASSLMYILKTRAE